MICETLKCLGNRPRIIAMQQADNLKLYFKVIFLAQQADIFENPDIGTIELIGRAHVLL